VEVPEKSGEAFYVFIDSHMARIVGSMSLYSGSPEWPKMLPYYYLDNQGELKTQGMIADEKPLAHLLFRFLQQSAFVQYEDIDIPFEFSDYHFRLMTAIFREIKRKLAETGMSDFYVLFFPGSGLAKGLIPYLDKAEIKSIDYSPIILPKYVSHPLLEGDGHPTKETYEFLGERLVQDLNLL
jgi:hypothetical protein